MPDRSNRSGRTEMARFETRAATTPADQDDLAQAAGEAAAVREDLRAVLTTLEDARREFDVWLGADQAAEAATAIAAAPEPEPASAPEPFQVSATGTGRFRDRTAPLETAAPRPPADMPAEIASAEHDARAYLEDAKRRVDTLVRTMLGSVEEEAWALRKEAEEGIRARWQEVEEHAGEYLNEARRSAEELVSERRIRIGELSDSITRGAERVTARLEDADRVRAQFDRLVHSLSVAADRIAREIEETGFGGFAEDDRPGDR